MWKVILCGLYVFLANLAWSSEPQYFWCNERYLSVERRPFDAKHLRVAKRGYLYALAAAVALQKDNPEGRSHHFALPARMREVNRPPRDPSGFEAASFEIRSADASGALQELVIAFTGSNDDTDWRETNMGSDRRQYRAARRYLAMMAAKPEYAGLRIVVAGFSLGGALAVHVTKHKETSALVAETWAFNPSPKIWANGRPDRRIWLAATESEALHFARNSLVASVVPGVGMIGAPPSQTAEGFYLLASNPVYSHFRWVLTRNILHAADLAIMAEQSGLVGTEPLEILRASHFASCGNNF